MLGINVDYIDVTFILLLRYHWPVNYNLHINQEQENKRVCILNS